MSTRLRNVGLLLALLLCLIFGIQQWNKHTETGLTAPGTAATTATTTNTNSVSPEPQWEVGVRRTYALATTRLMHFRSNPAPGEKAEPSEETLRYELRGLWESTVVRADAVFVQLRVQLKNLKLTPGDAATPSELAKMQAELSAPFFVNLEPSGKLRALRVRKDVGVMSRGWLKSLAATLQFIRPKTAGTSWTTEEADATGEYVASYRLAADQAHCEKSRQKYTRIASGDGMVAASEIGKVTGALALTFGLQLGASPAEVLREVKGRDTIEVDPGPGMPRVASESDITFTLQTSDRDAAAAGAVAVADSAEYEIAPLGMTERNAQADARRDDERLLKGATFAELQAALLAIPATDDGRQRAQVQAKLEALARLSDEAARKAAQSATAKETPPRAAKTLLGALGGAGTPAAQSNLVQIAENKALSTDLRSNALAVLGLGDHPQEATTEALLKASSDSDPEISSTALLALGNTSLALRKSGQTTEADQGVEELLQRLQNARTQDDQLLYLQALGNAGDARAVPAITTALATPAAAVRNAAVVALRFIEGPQVDQLIASTLAQDPATEVRRGAVYALSFRSLSVFLPALQKAVLSDGDANVRADVVAVLGKAMALPGVAALLRTVAEKDASPDVRRSAQALLASSR